MARWRDKYREIAALSVLSDNMNENGGFAIHALFVRVI